MKDITPAELFNVLLEVLESHGLQQPLQAEFTQTIQNAIHVDVPDKASVSFYQRERDRFDNIIRHHIFFTDIDDLKKKLRDSIKLKQRDI